MNGAKALLWETASGQFVTTVASVGVAGEQKI